MVWVLSNGAEDKLTFQQFFLSSLSLSLILQEDFVSRKWINKTD